MYRRLFLEDGSAELLTPENDNEDDDIDDDKEEEVTISSRSVMT